FDPVTRQLFAGAPAADPPGGPDDAGAVVIYGLAEDPVDPGVFQWRRITARGAVGGAAGDAFGTSLSLYGDVLAVGAPQHGSSGAVFRFGRNIGGPGAWGFERRVLDGGAAAGAAFGSSVVNLGS